MNDGASAKQQIVERIKSNSNILVTLSTDPSVDELSAALGLTIMLNNIKKHATAVVSGEIPPAIEFLEPGKTFENTVDSLRDFIIALDKEKADHLRYKVDGDVVKIFITPYRTTISDEDLDFSQGDYNVELVIALGVKDKDHLDKALEAHGRILHDATVATLSCCGEPSQLGSIDWFESGASSISEMLVSLSEALKGDKPVLDEQIATAFLTGIVAATDRFSNDKTSSKVMTMAAQLMAAGANQQLIAAKLSEAHEISSHNSDDSSDNDSDDTNSDGTTNMSEGKDTKLERKSSKKKKSAEKPAEKKEDDGALAISHEKEGDLDAVANQVSQENTKSAAEQAESALSEQLQSMAPSAAATTPSVSDLQKDIAAASADVDDAAADAPAEPVANTAPPTSLPELPMDYEPIMGGTLNATTEQAAEDKRREEANDQNKTILNHGEGKLAKDSQPTFATPQFNAASPSSAATPSDQSQAAGEPDSAPTASLPPMPPISQSAPITQETLADIDQKNRSGHDEARAAVDAALGSAPFDPAHNPTLGSGAQPLGDQIHADQSIPDTSGMPPLPDFSTLPPPPPAFPTAPAPQAASAQAPDPNTPFPPAEPEQLGQILGEAPQQSAPEQPNDPNQFRIPGQS